MFISQKFEFSIGDHVALIHPIEYSRVDYNTTLEMSPENDFIINKIIYSVGKMYSFGLTYNEPQLSYEIVSTSDKGPGMLHNVPESNLVPVGNVETPFYMDYRMNSLYGEDVNIGDDVYCDVIRRRLCYSTRIIDPVERITVDPAFTFSAHGTVCGMKVEVEHWGTEKAHHTGYVFIKRDFICTYDDGKPIHDSRMEGQVHEALCNCTVCKEIPDNFVEMYVQECLAAKMDPVERDNDFVNYTPIHRWFDFIESHSNKWPAGTLYDEMIRQLDNAQVKKAAKKVKTKSQKPSIKNRISKMLNALSDEERKELTRQLNERKDS